jgi:beta-glucosidase-like glycosyl hydrolase
MLAPEVLIEPRRVHQTGRIVIFTAHPNHRGFTAAMDAEAEDVGGTATAANAPARMGNVRFAGCRSSIRTVT